MSFKTILPNNFLCEIDNNIIRLFEPVKLTSIFGARYRYYMSREVIDFEVQWLTIDNSVIDSEIQKYISALVKNMAFL